MCIVLLDCNQYDSRGVEWHGFPYERVNKSCNEGGFQDIKFVEGEFLFHRIDNYIDKKLRFFFKFNLFMFRC